MLCIILFPKITRRVLFGYKNVNATLYGIRILSCLLNTFHGGFLYLRDLQGVLASLYLVHKYAVQSLKMLIVRKPQFAYVRIKGTLALRLLVSILPCAYETY